LPISSFQKPPLGARINWEHPRARGLVGCWLFNERGGNRISDLSPSKNDGAFAGSPAWIPDALSLNGGAGSWVNFGYKQQFVFGSSDFTICLRMIKNAETASWSNVFFLCRGDVGADTDNNSFRWILTTDGTNEIPDFIIRKTGASVEAMGTQNLVIDRAYSMAAVRRGDTLNQYINGVLDGTSAGASGDIANGGAYPLMLCSSGTGSSSSSVNGTIYYVYIYNRALSPDEITALCASPYEMFEEELPLELLYVASPATYRQRVIII
jgi:hypothetical protein